jgi:glycosyltransferase involved in cell wall biosynthesis
MKRVLCVLNEVSYSGAEVMIKNAVSHMRALGFDWEVLSTGPTPGDYVKEMMAENIRVHHIPFSKNPVFFLKFGQLLQREQFDVLHIHCERASFWYALTGWISKVPRIVRTYHNVFYFKGALRIRRVLQRWMGRRVFGIVNHAIGPSVQRCEWETYKNPTNLILNWVDETCFSDISPDEKASARKSLQISQNPFVIASIGMCRKEKNHENILHAIRLSRLAEGDLFYIHVGIGPLLLQEQEVAERIGVEDQVWFAGQRPSDDMRVIYAACDVVVMPSDYEGLTMVIVEAMRCGRPIIAYDVPGLRDFNYEQMGGLWISPSVEALAEALRSFAKSPDLVSRKSAEAIEVANRFFSRDISLQALAQLYSGEAPDGKVV